MASEPTGAAAPSHAPFARSEFLRLRLTRDPDEAYSAVLRIIAEHRARPDVALERCSEWIDGHGCEVVSLADGSELLYTNKGDTFAATLCYVPGRGWFVSSWGDVVEAADRGREEESDERRCAYCSEWAEPGEPCGSCGRDPETGDPIPEPLRRVRLECGYVLKTWDTGRTRGTGMMERTRIGYELRDPAGAVVFRGTDYSCGACTAIDSDDSLRGLLGFLTLRPGDTDAEYFDSYSPEQRAFAESSDCELLAFLYSDDGEGEFADLDDDDDGADEVCDDCRANGPHCDCSCRRGADR